VKPFELQRLRGWGRQASQQVRLSETIATRRT